MLAWLTFFKWFFELTLSLIRSHDPAWAIWKTGGTLESLPQYATRAIGSNVKAVSAYSATFTNPDCRLCGKRTSRLPSS